MVSQGFLPLRQWEFLPTGRCLFGPPFGSPQPLLFSEGLTSNSPFTPVSIRNPTKQNRLWWSADFYFTLGGSGNTRVSMQPSLSGPICLFTDWCPPRRSNVLSTLQPALVLRAVPLPLGYEVSSFSLFLLWMKFLEWSGLVSYKFLFSTIQPPSSNNKK